MKNHIKNVLNYSKKHNGEPLSFPHNLKKGLQVILLTLLLFFVTIWGMSATVTFPQINQVTLRIEKGTMLEAIQAIENQSEYTFVYKVSEINLDQTISVSVENKDIIDVMNSLCNNINDIGYRIVDHHIALFKKAAPIIVPQQEGRQIQGTVTDDTGVPIIGANIVVVGTTNGSITNIDGEFSLSVQPNSTLRVSYIGYLTQEVQVNADRVMYNIMMHEDTETLDEVVVIGYGTVKKSDVTGSIVSVSSEDMLKRNPVNIGQGLQGVAAGVSVSRNSGDPRGQVTIRIRGVATVNNSADPLYVVDGIQVGKSIEFLNPNDVESIEVLKDASATAIYGSQGANGVIMITTKRGEKGRTSLKFSANFGIQTLAETLDVMNAEQFVLAARRAAAGDGNVLTNGAWINYDRQLNSIDWQKEMSQTALQQNYNLSVSGGNENTQAVLSVGYLNNDGTIIDSNFKRLTARANIDHKVKDFIRAGVNLSYMHTERYGEGNMLTYATIIPTMDDVDVQGNLLNMPIRYPDGKWGHFKSEGNGDTNKGQDNPVAEARTRDRKNYDNQVVANAYIDFDIVKGLVFKTIGGVNYAGESLHEYTMKHDRTFMAIGQPDRFRLEQEQKFTLSLESYLTYELNLNNIHRINLLAGYSISRYKPQDVKTNASDFPAETIRRIELVSNKSSINAEGGLGRELRGESFFGRANYSLMDKYLLTATIRRDGSSNFGAGNRYGTFPSASLAWRASEEEFMKRLNWLSNLKVRVGWGQTGNAGNSTNRSIDQLSSSRIAYYHYINGGEVVAPGLAQTREIDTGLKWEKNEQTNIGLDIGILNNNLNFSFDYFVRDAKDLLLNRPLRPSTGYSDIYTNAGHIRNSGFEFMATYQKQLGDWYVNVRLSGATLKNRAKDVGADIYFNENVDSGDYWNNYSLTRNGYPVASFYGWRIDGVFQNKEEIDALNAKVDPENNSGYYQSASTQPGDYKYKDINGDGWIDEEDREVLGHGYPKVNYGLNLILGYKNWDFNMTMNGVFGQKILSHAYKNLTSMYVATGGYRNVLKEYADKAWTPENRSNKYPRLTKQDANHNGQVSDAFLKNGDYLKIQNLQVGYTFPKSMIQALRMENLRVFASVENLLTITGYEAGDPEIGTEKVLQTGFDGGRYPFPRTYVFGLTVGF